VNQWSERANRASSFLYGLFDHFDGAFDAKAKPVFIRKENFHQCALSYSVDLNGRGRDIVRSVVAAFLPPLFAKPIASRNPLVNPSNFPIQKVTHFAQERLFEVAKGVRNVLR
jgi:hypothetical protein